MLNPVNKIIMNCVFPLTLNVHKFPRLFNLYTTRLTSTHLLSKSYNVHCGCKILCKTQQNVTLKSRLTVNSNLIVRKFRSSMILKSSSSDINTNVVKDVILFKYDNPKFFKILNLFALCQFIFWTYLSHFAFTTLRDAPIEKSKEDLPWWRKINLGENKYRNTLTICSFLIGYGILSAAWAFTLKSVRFLVLRKGGNAVTFVTYTPFGTNRLMTVNLKNVSCQESRNTVKVTLPIKVKNKVMFYMLDMKGEFLNPKLFDRTAGLMRNLK